MKLQDVKTTVLQSVAQALGQTYMEQNGYLEEIPVENLTDVGKAITDTTMATERFTSTLSSLMARRIIDEGNFTPIYGDMIIDRILWGSYVEYTKIDFAEVIEDAMLTPVDGKDYSALEHTFYKPKASTKVFEEGKGICIPLSYQRDNLMESFTNYDSLNAYIEKIKAKQLMTLREVSDRYCAMLAMAGILISAKATQTAVYLLDEALSAGIKGITAETTSEDALNNSDYILFCAKKMNEIRENMKVSTAVYNNGSWAVGSSDNILYLLTKYSNALQFDVRSNVFNKDEISLGKYKSIPMWQAVRASADASGFDYTTASTVKVSADKTNKLGIGKDAVELSDVIGFLWDRKALGYCVFREKMTSNYTSCADFWTDWLHYLTNQLVNSDYPMVAFINGRKAVATTE